MTFVFFISLKLTCIISGRKVLDRLILVSIFLMILINFVLIFLGWSIVFKISKVNSLVFESSWKFTFIFVLTAFLNTFFHKSKLCLWLSNCAWIERYRSLQNYYIKVSLWKTVVRPNFLKTTCKYFRCTTQSKAFSSWYWEVFFYLSLVIINKGPRVS